MHKKPPVRRWLGQGKGYLSKQRPTDRRDIHAPHYRGYLQLPKDYKKGSKMTLAAWVHKNKYGVILFIKVVTMEVRQATIKRAIDIAIKDRDFRKQIVMDNAEYQAGQWPRKKPPRTPTVTEAVEIKRKDAM